MSVPRALRKLYPDIEFLNDCIVANGKIEYWNEAKLGPQPTQQQLDAVTERDADDAEETHDIKRAFELSKKDKVLIKWIAQLHGLSAQDVRTQLRNIWKNS